MKKVRESRVWDVVVKSTKKSERTAKCCTSEKLVKTSETIQGMRSSLMSYGKACMQPKESIDDKIMAIFRILTHAREEIKEKEYRFA